MKKIYNVGCVPPPVGGVAYFLQRLKQQLDKRQFENEIIDVSGVDYASKRKKGIKCLNYVLAFFYLLKNESGIIVFHSNRTPVLLGALMLHFKHKILIFTHGESILKKATKGKRFLLKYVDGIVSPIAELTDRIEKMYPEFEDKIYHVPFVLYPAEIGTIDDLPMKEFRDKYSFLVIGYAYKITKMDDTDLYGVDMMIELMAQLRERGYEKIGMILIIPDFNDSEYERMTLDTVYKKGLDNIYIHKGSVKEASDVFASGELYVRPSISDGDSFAVWESLYVGTPVIASDAVKRPKGCITFNNRDINDFVNKVVYVYQNYDDIKAKTESLDIKGSEEELFSLFASYSEK